VSVGAACKWHFACRQHEIEAIGHPVNNPHSPRRANPRCTAACPNSQNIVRRRLFAGTVWRTTQYHLFLHCSRPESGKVRDCSVVTGASYHAHDRTLAPGLARFFKILPQCQFCLEMLHVSMKFQESNTSDRVQVPVEIRESASTLAPPSRQPSEISGVLIQAGNWARISIFRVRAIQLLPPASSGSLEVG
jgi:hypothetical protein